MSKIFNVVIASWLALYAGTSVHADTLPANKPAGPDEGWYLGGSFGDFNDEVVNGSDSAWKIFGGYRVVSTQLEFGYVNLGTVSESTAVGDITSETTGYSLAVMDHVPVTTNISLFAKLGVFHWKSDVSAAASGTEAGDRDKGTDLTYGLGFQYNIGERIGVRTEWERFEDDIGDLLSLGVVVKF